MMDFQKLLSDDDFVTRDQCGPGWTVELVDFTRVADLTTGLAYVVIPVFLVLAVIHLRGILPTGLLFFNFVGFAFFIFFCGAAHFLDYLVFEWAPYRLIGTVKAATAVASWVEVALLVVTYVWWLCQSDGRAANE